MKYIVIVPDGMADWPVKDIGGKTPLEAAHTTNMDYMAQRGTVGCVQTIPRGMKPGSDIGNLAIMGYDPRTCFSGRAPLEAANLGIDMAEDEVAFRCNLVTVENNTMVDYSAGHIKTSEAAEIIESLNEKLRSDTIRFHAGKSYRHLLILKARNTRTMVGIRTCAPHDIMGQDIRKYLPSGKNAEILQRIMEQAAKILEGHPVNNVRLDLKENPASQIWLWGQGVRPALPPFEERFGIKGAVISAVDLVNGIGKLAGLDIIRVPGITGYYDTNYKGKASYALSALKDHDFVFIHIEAPDEAGHNGDWKNKIAAIEHIDREIVGEVLNHFNEHDDFRVLILPDHATPVEKRTHTDEPVCFLMFGKHIRSGGAPAFTEAGARTADIHFHSGEELMRSFLGRTP